MTDTLPGSGNIGRFGSCGDKFEGNVVGSSHLSRPLTYSGESRGTRSRPTDVFDLTEHVRWIQGEEELKRFYERKMGWADMEEAGAPLVLAINAGWSFRKCEPLHLYSQMHHQRKIA